MIDVKETDNQSVVCPHCEKTLGPIHAVKTRSKLGVRYVYTCGLCRKVLGVSQRKGFWMG